MTAPTTIPNEQGPKLTKATPVSLRNAGVTEGWLQNEIDKDPTILTIEISAAIKRAEDIAAGTLRTSGNWMAGFHFNGALSYNAYFRGVQVV